MHSTKIVASWKELYQTIQPFHAFRSETPILRTLLTVDIQEAVFVWRDLLIELPPSHYRSTAASVETLIRRGDWATEDVFPKLLNALEHPTTIASVLDLANWVVRNEADIDHPARHLSDRLNGLLEAVVGRLQQIETNPASLGTDVRVIQRILDESVALCIALCDTLGLIQHESSIEVLRQAAKLRHRRIECEAAAALARMNDDSGKLLLIKLAAEPIARQRVLVYAEELGLLDRIDERWTTELARAEAQMAAWLASPRQLWDCS